MVKLDAQVVNAYEVYAVVNDPLCSVGSEGAEVLEEGVRGVGPEAAVVRFEEDFLGAFRQMEGCEVGSGDALFSLKINDLAWPDELFERDFEGGFAAIHEV
jgi:hypothetical protein